MKLILKHYKIHTVITQKVVELLWLQNLKFLHVIRTNRMSLTLKAKETVATLRVTRMWTEALDFCTYVVSYKWNLKFSCVPLFIFITVFRHKYTHVSILVWIKMLYLWRSLIYRAFCKTTSEGRAGVFKFIFNWLVVMQWNVEQNTRV